MMTPERGNGIDISFVVPVYNGERTIGRVARGIQAVFHDLAIEIVLINDGSSDASEAACRQLRQEMPETITFVHLARNFGEHSAVLAGLHHTSGAYVIVLDDDGQNPPEESRRLYDEILRTGVEVVYGKYRIKQHSGFRNFASRLNGWLANLMLKKPHDLYLSSFKIMSRFIVQEITKYQGSFPYIDGLILRTTRNLGQIDVEHQPNPEGRTNYTLRKLVGLWLNMFLNFSIMPLRAAVVLGLLASGSSLILIVFIVIDKLFFTPQMTLGIPTVLVTVVLFAGIQLVVLGVIGEYLGRLFLDHSRTPQFVIRYVEKPEPSFRKSTATAEISPKTLAPSARSV